MLQKILYAGETMTGTGTGPEEGGKSPRNGGFGLEADPVQTPCAQGFPPGDAAQLRFLEEVWTRMAEVCDYTQTAEKVVACLDRILWRFMPAQSLTPGLKVYCLAKGMPLQEHPSMHALNEKLLDLSRRLCERESQHREKKWAAVKGEVATCFQKYAGQETYKFPKCKDSGAWEVWLSKVCVDILREHITLSELHMEIILHPNIYPFYWKRVDFKRPLGPVIEDLWDSLQEHKHTRTLVWSPRPEYNYRP